MSRGTHWAGTALAVAATAVAGSAATNPGQAWYRKLDKPSWQPPPAAFPVVWTALYTDIAAVSALVLDRLEREGRDAEARSYRRALAVNLALNAGWSITFFGRRQVRPAVLVAGLLAASSADLARRAGRVRPAYRRALAPYAGWTAFATVLNGEIARRNG